ncbi:TPA: OsmC family protein [Citrobacter koseri]|uniref:OsmC family protein n=1 Tax=Citrobacter koseri TaxID=545 RepID=UPI00190254E2|nr:OsmC family protein [Citrobacter koseri]MBJ8987282.1 OsmC family protein [Citrobacter koseri]HEM7934604.1 OsmC family protein [Citrobacter koseri]
MNSLLNGVDATRLAYLKHHLTISPDNSKARFDVSTSWQDGMKSASCCHPSSVSGSVNNAEFAVVCADEPVTLGGGGKSPSPQELMLMAFNACMSAAYVTNATLAGVILEKLQIRTKAMLDLRGFFGTDQTISPGTEKIQYLITVKGDGSVEQFEQIHQAVIASSPNRWVISQGMQIEGDQIVEK